MGSENLKLPKPVSESIANFVVTYSKVERRMPSSGWQASSLGLPAQEIDELIRNIEKGIPFAALTQLAESTGLTVERLSGLMKIPARTLARRRQAGKLDAVESERLVNVATVFERALDLFSGDRAQAVEWLLQPKQALGGEAPLAYARTTLGVREVENLIGRIEHGVFS